MPAKALRRAADSGDVIFSFQSKTFAGLQNRYYQPADTLQAKNNILLSAISIPQTNPGFQTRAAREKSNLEQ
jgi:hypothetical protein